MLIKKGTNNALPGNDTLYVPRNTVKRLQKNRRLKKGMNIKRAKTNIRKQVGGNLLTSIISLGRAFAPSLAKTIGLSALAGAASEGASQIVEKISGNGIQSGGFLIPQNKVNQLITCALMRDAQVVPCKGFFLAFSPDPARPRSSVIDLQALP